MISYSYFVTIEDGRSEESQTQLLSRFERELLLRLLGSGGTGLDEASTKVRKEALNMNLTARPQFGRRLTCSSAQNAV